MTSRSSAGRAPDDDPSTSAAIVVDDAMSLDRARARGNRARRSGRRRGVARVSGRDGARGERCDDVWEMGEETRALIHERAVRHNPILYKLWFFYLRERVDDVRGLRCDDVEHERVISCFERALATMHKMPRVWELYLRYLTSLKYVTRTRRACDAALCALPVTQHDRVWAIYLEFVRSDERIPGDTARRVYRRYLKFEPGHAEEYVEFLKRRGYEGETAAKLAELVDDDAFQSLAGKSKHAMWLELCDIITKHPAEVHEYSAGASGRALDVDAVLRGGIRTFSGETGRLWTALADYYIRRGLFEKARDVYEEGMESVATVRDFSLIFDAYAQFEEASSRPRWKTKTKTKTKTTTPIRRSRSCSDRPRLLTSSSGSRVSNTSWSVDRFYSPPSSYDKIRTTCTSGRNASRSSKAIQRDRSSPTATR